MSCRRRPNSVRACSSRCSRGAPSCGGSISSACGPMRSRRPEQSGRTDVPGAARSSPRPNVRLAAWPAERKVLFCDEAGDAPAIANALRDAAPGPWAIFTGPEGGFDPAERDALRACPFVVPVTLGERILRADTRGAGRPWRSGRRSRPSGGSYFAAGAGAGGADGCGAEAAAERSGSSRSSSSSMCRRRRWRGRSASWPPHPALRRPGPGSRWTA